MSKLLALAGSVSLLLALFATDANAQSKARDLVLVKSGGGAFFVPGTSAPTGATSEAKPISVDDHMVVEAYYYDDDKNRTAFFVTLQDENGRPLTSYLAQLIDSPQTNNLPNGVKLILLGPQFYEAYKVMSMKVTVLRFGEDNSKLKLFETIKKYADVTAKFIPVVGQALGYAEMGLEVLKDQLGKDATYEFNFDIRRDALKPSTAESWRIFSGGKVEPKINALSSFDVDTNGGRSHISWPASIGKIDGYAMFIGVYQEDPVVPYRQVLEYLRLIQDKYSAYLRDKPIKADEINTNDAAVQNAQISHLMNAFWARLQIAKASDNSTEESVRELFEFADRLSTLTQSQGALVKLTPEKEREFAGTLTGLFTFTIKGDKVAPEGEDYRESGFQRLTRWGTWFKNRKDNSKVLVWSSNKQTLYPYATATDLYARAEAQRKLDSAIGDKQILKGGEIRALDSLLDFFSPNPQEPWLFYEQKSVAMWLNEKFNFNLAALNLTSTPADVKAFGENFKAKLAAAKVLKLNNGRWSSSSPVQFVWNDSFLPELKKIAEAGNNLKLNQHEKLEELYKTAIEKNGSLLSEAERQEVEDKFSGLLVGEKLKKEFVDKKAGALFANYVLSVDTPNTPQIREVRFQIGAYISLYKRMCEDPNNLLPGSMPTPVKNNLLAYIQDPERLQDIAEYIASDGKGVDMSVRQRAVRFLQMMVPGLAEKPNLIGVPTNDTEAKAWAAAFLAEQGMEWVDGECRFEFKSTLIDEARLKALENRFSQFNEFTLKASMKTFIRDVMKFVFTDNGPSKPAKIQEKAIIMLKTRTVLPQDLSSADVREASTWDTFLGLDLDWGKDCRKIVVKSVGCNPTQTPGP